MSSSAPSHLERLEAALQAAPLVAILRGITLDEAEGVVTALYDAGIRIAEVPLNSPKPFETIAMLVARFGDRMVIGGGTVTTPAQVAQLAQCGAALCVSPNTNPEVIRGAVAAGMVAMPGFQTASEAFVAIEHGARYVKFFPAGGNASALSAMRAVLPKDVRVVAVGGVGVHNQEELLAAGATVFGIGSEIYRPGNTAAQVGASAKALLAAMGHGGPVKRVSLVCNPEALIGEAPCVVNNGGAIRWVDPLQKRLMTASLPSGVVTRTGLPFAVWSIAALPAGHLAGTVDEGFCTVDSNTGVVAKGPAAAQAPGCRFNDMAVDPLGGLWAGSMHKGLLATTGALFYAPTAAAACRQVAQGLGAPNGMKFSPDGKTLFVLDTQARTLLAFPADIERGTLGEPHVLTDFMGIPGKPDGMALGDGGTFWVAMWGGSCVVQIAANGGLLRTVALPAPHVSSVCLDAQGTLYASTSRMRLSLDQIAQAPGSGGLFAIKLNT